MVHYIPFQFYEKEFLLEVFVRVIAGSIRGLRLSAPDGVNTRPTLDRVKEAVFSMLMPYLNDAVVLDLFAGSGAMGIEAVSRGASRSVFVDSDKTAIDCVKANIASCKIGERTSVFHTDSIRYLSECSEKFDIIFLDPPYFNHIYDSVLELISKKNLLSSHGIIVVEWDYEYGFVNKSTDFSVVKEKKYGRVGITTLKRVKFK